MIKDRIEEIVEMLISSTEKGDLIWNIEIPKMNGYDNIRELSCISPDLESKFNISIKYYLTNGITWVLESTPSLFIKNKNISTFIANTSHTEKIKDLRDYLNNKYCKDFIPSEDNLEVEFLNICKSISPVSYRDKKINNILDEKG